MFEINAWMVYSRHHWSTTQAGFFLARSTGAAGLLMMVAEILFRTLHVPLIGRMFWTMVTVPSPLWTSLFMDLVNVYRHMEGFGQMQYWFAMYPAFAAQYMHVD